LVFVEYQASLIFSSLKKQPSLPASENQERNIYSFQFLLVMTHLSSGRTRTGRGFKAAAEVCKSNLAAAVSTFFLFVSVKTSKI